MILLSISIGIFLINEELEALRAREFSASEWTYFDHSTAYTVANRISSGPWTSTANTELPLVSVDTLLGYNFPRLHKYFILFCLRQKSENVYLETEKNIFFIWGFLNSKVLYYLSF